MLAAQTLTSAAAAARPSLRRRSTRLRAATKPPPVRQNGAKTQGATGGSGGPSPPQRPERKEGFMDTMSFGGWAPELINGRVAQVGFVAGLGAEIATGESFPQQFQEHWGALAGAAFVIAVASFMPKLQSYAVSANPAWNKGQATGYDFGPFKVASEQLNSRAAMVGIAAMLVIEGLKGGPLLGFNAVDESAFTPLEPSAFEQQYEDLGSSVAPAPSLPAPPVQTPAPAAPQDSVSSGSAATVAPEVADDYSNKAFKQEGVEPAKVTPEEQAEVDADGLMRELAALRGDVSQLRQELRQLQAAR